MYHTQPETGSIDTSPDFTLEGRDYFINSELDFENPITDYDKLCQKLDLALTYKFPHGEMLALDAFFDDFGWDKEQYWFCNGVISKIDAEIFEKLEWLTLCHWTVQTESIYFINACCTPLEAEINLSKGIEYQKIKIKKGRYQVKFADTIPKTLRNFMFIQVIVGFRQLMTIYHFRQNFNFVTTEKKHGTHT